MIKGLSEYLTQEEKNIEKSRERWGPELKAFEDLALLYSNLNKLVSVSDVLMLTIADLFLIVQVQMYGAVSQLLRRRRIDSELLTRRAIEAAATANRLLLHPELLETFSRAHEGIESRDDEKQWQPSEEYRKAFSTGKLFGEPKDFWRTLRVDYDMFSVMAAHSGLGATTSHVTIEELRVLYFFEPDDKNLDRTWYHLLGIYWGLLKVMFHVLRNRVQNKKAEAYGQDILWWREKAASLMNKRVPWIKEKQVSGTSILVVPY